MPRETMSPRRRWSMPTKIFLSSKPWLPRYLMRGFSFRRASKACFPEKLPQLCIELLSYKNDVILDPFSGSGTTCYVAKCLNRHFVGFEISENYYNESISRLNGRPYKVIDNDNPYNAKRNNSQMKLF